MNLLFSLFLLLAQAEPLAKISYETPEVKTATESDLKSAISAIAVMAPGHFNLPKEITISVSAISKFPEEDNGALKLAEQIDLGKNLKSDAAFFKTLVAHEYGHVVLHENLLTSPELSGYFIKGTMPANQQVAFKDFFTAYDELFADLVSAVLAKDASIVKKSLTPEGVSKSARESASVRDFKNTAPLEGWSYVGPYGRLSPARAYLWSIILKDPSVLSTTPGLILERTILVIRQVALIHLKALATQSFPAPGFPADGEIEQTNREFMSALKKAWLLK